MKKKSFILFVGVATLYFQNAYAQESTNDSTRVSEIDQVVITGSANPKKRLESSVAITTMKAAEIQERDPQSTAEILQYVPGFVAETSGGEVGNNLFARGIPSAGAYEYVQIQEDGLPIFEDGALQFANIDNFQRIDLTLKNVEAVRGGSAAVFASGAPGGIVNFISQTGQNDLKGTFKIGTGTYGLFRTDFNVGGALIEDKLFFNAGGFYRIDNGVRNPGFKGNKGGQIKMNLTYKLDKGFARVYYKHLDDHNIFYQVTPFVKDGDKVKAYPGFNAHYGTFALREMAPIRVPQYGGGFFETDLRDGIHPVSDAIGAEFKYDLSDKVTVNNNFKYTKINEDYNAIYAPAWMGTIVSQDDYATGVGVDTADALFTYVSSGETLDSSVNLKRADLWYINKKMQNFANNLNFNFKLDPVKLNVGYYYSNWNTDQYWNWNSFLITADDNPRLVNLQDTSTDMNYTYNGISQITWLERQSGLTGDVNALFANADIKINDKFNANVGLRYDMDRYKGYRDNASFNSQNLGVLSNSTADDAVTTIQGNPYTYWDYDVNELSYTAALNFKISSRFATYFRQSRGFRAPIEESFYDAAGKGTIDDLKVTTINQSELGFNGQITRNIALFASLFHMKLKDIPYQDIVAGGVSEGKFADVKNTGLELETIGNFRKFHFNINATIQNPKYADFKGTNSDNTSFNYDGNVARRIPKFYFIVRPDYDITEKLNAFVKWSYFGKKYNDEGNTFVLAAFNTWDAGLSYKINNIRFAMDVTNIFNTIGLTEGDGSWSGLSNGDVVFGRSIVGTSARASITLDF